MFEGPESASYIALCRELQLQRVKFEPGDWCTFDVGGGSSGPYLIELDDEGASTDFVHPRNHGRYIWLPRLDQWLAMLEEAYAAKWKEATAGPCRPGQARKMALDMLAVASERFPRESIEEIAARLWCAVTGRAVTGEKVSP